MSELENYIEGQVRSHLVRWEIDATELQVERIVSSVLSGDSVFNLIYDENGSLLIHSAIDASMVVFRPGDGYYVNSYSYDGGRRFQWYEKETLVIDRAGVREVKLSGIGI